MVKFRVAGDERALLFKHDVFVRLLESGEHRLWGTGFHVTRHKLSQPFTPEYDLEQLLADSKLAAALDLVDVADDELALHFEDRHFRRFLKPGKHAFWKGRRAHQFTRVSLAEAEVSKEIDRAILVSEAAAEFVQDVELPSHAEGLLSVDGVFRRKLQAGRYFFWKGRQRVVVLQVDKRQQQLEISGQEIMSQDHVALRMNFICQYRIVDPETALLKIQNHTQQIHILLQLVLREYVGTLRLDEILQKKEEIGPYVLSRLENRGGEFGVEFVFAGVRDIILPGEIQSIMNTVIAAEKKAQANIITRREETASTRSLLNTAKLMEENPVLYRLKELEYLERVCEKVGTISVSAGNSILDHLAGMIGQKSPQA